jgi:hypothetical protein
LCVVTSLMCSDHLIPPSRTNECASLATAIGLFLVVCLSMLYYPTRQLVSCKLYVIFKLPVIHHTTHILIPLRHHVLQSFPLPCCCFSYTLLDHGTGHRARCNELITISFSVSAAELLLEYMAVMPDYPMWNEKTCMAK